MFFLIEFLSNFFKGIFLASYSIIIGNQGIARENMIKQENPRNIENKGENITKKREKNTQILKGKINLNWKLRQVCKCKYYKFDIYNLPSVNCEN